MHQTIVTTRNPGPASAQFDLRFQSLFDEGRALVFPCDAAGQVDMAAMSERMRVNYLRARRAIGRDYSTPTIRPRRLH